MNIYLRVRHYCVNYLYHGYLKRLSENILNWCCVITFFITLFKNWYQWNFTSLTIILDCYVSEIKVKVPLEKKENNIFFALINFPSSYLILKPLTPVLIRGQSFKGDGAYNLYFLKTKWHIQRYLITCGTKERNANHFLKIVKHENRFQFWLLRLYHDRWIENRTEIWL